MSSLLGSLVGDLQPDISRGPELLAVAWSSTGLAIVMVALRMYTRIIHKNTGWDDYTILVALALCIFGSATVTISVQHGFGRHLYHLSFPQISKALEYSIYAEMSAYFSTFFIKISVCFFVFRLISGSQEKRVITRVLWALMAFVTLSCISSVITLAVECIPFSDIWNFAVLHRKCLPDYVQPLMIKIYGAIGAITDIACVAAPAYVIRKLQMALRIKITVILLVGLGLFTAGCSIAKAVTADLQTPDSTWDLVEPAIWQLLEQNLGTVVACAPALRQLLTRRKANSRPSKESSGRKSAGPNTPGQGISGIKKSFSSALERFKALGGSSGKTTNVSDQTTTTDATFIGMVDMEAGRVGKPAERSQGQTPDIAREAPDIEFHPVSQGEDLNRSNSERSSSDRSLIRRPELSEVDLGEPFPEQLVGRRGSQMMGNRDSQMVGNRDTDKEPATLLPLAPRPGGEARNTPRSRESRAAAQAPMIDVGEDRCSTGELPAMERRSEDFVVDRGVSIPMMDDFFSPWTGPGPSSAILPNASPIESTYASAIEELPAQPPATVEPPLPQSEPTEPHILHRRLQEGVGPPSVVAQENGLRTGSASERLQQYASSAMSSQNRLTASRRPSTVDVNKPLPPLPGRPRPSRYERTWV